MKTVTGDEGTSYWKCMKCGKATDPCPVQGKSFFDYSLREKKEIVEKAARESNRMQREMVVKANKRQPFEWIDEAVRDVLVNGTTIPFPREH